MSTYQPGQDVVVSWTGMPGNVQDFAAISTAGSADDQYVTFSYISAQTSGSHPFSGLAAGNYEARMYLNNTYAVLARASLTITVSSGAGATVPLPVVGVDVPDHVAAALARLPEQDKNKTNIAALISVCVAPAQALESALWQLLTQRQVGTAIGAQLDALGKLVNAARNGASDADYPRFIKAQVSTNSSKGRIEDLLTIAKLILNNSAAVTVAKPEGTATIRVSTLNVAVTASTAAIVYSFLSQAVAAGVQLIYQWSTVAPASTFRFDVGPGLDVGALSSELG